MLSVAKVKLHGMSDSRWQTANKISQYRGVVKLFERDAVVLTNDFHMKRKKLKRDWVETKKRIVTDRKLLDELSLGDKQSVLNALAPFRRLKLAFGELHMTQIEEAVSHRNFLLRKESDRIKYSIKKRCEHMADARLTIADLEDRMNLLCERTKLDMQIENLSGKTQAMILKQDAAIAVGLTYKRIIDIMKADNVYMNGVLSALERDCINQGDCLYMTIQMGQMATEYLDDRRTEFFELEKNIKKTRVSRLKSLDDVKRDLKKLKKSTKNLIKKESDINIGFKNLGRGDFLSLTESIEDLEKVFARINNVVAVSNYEAIFPSLIRQRQQSEHLKLMVDDSIEQKNKLDNKTKNTALKLETLNLTMTDHTIEYQERRDALKSNIANSEFQLQTIGEETTRRANVLIQINIYIKKLYEICLPVRLEKTSIGEKKKVVPGERKQPEAEAADLANLMKKLSTIMKYTTGLPESTDQQTQACTNMYSKLLGTYCYKYVPKAEQIMDSLIEDFAVADSSIPTRVSVKDESARIVTENNVDPDLVQLVPKKKRR